jgi:hypothetical protein
MTSTSVPTTQRKPQHLRRFHLPAWWYEVRELHRLRPIKRPRGKHGPKLADHPEIGGAGF